MKTIDGADVKVGDTVYQWCSCEPWTVGERAMNTEGCFYSTRRLALEARIANAREIESRYHVRIKAAQKELAEVEAERQAFEAELAKEPVV